MRGWWFSSRWTFFVFFFFINDESSGMEGQFVQAGGFDVIAEGGSKLLVPRDCPIKRGVPLRRKERKQATCSTVSGYVLGGEGRHRSGEGFVSLSSAIERKGLHIVFVDMRQAGQWDDGDMQGRWGVMQCL